jgi:uracil-DNA glycosylase
MFIGEGPGATEEEEGRPFVGRSGEILREAIERIELPSFYISNTVACRSCRPKYDNEGQPRTRFNRETRRNEQIFEDVEPTNDQIQACLPRLYEEIYLVDPLFIVAVGAPASKTLLKGKKIAITTESGVERAIEIPGAWYTAVLTEKRQVWLRKVRGKVINPVAQNSVRYLMIPIIHPAHLLRKSADERIGAVTDIFVRTMKKISSVYYRIIAEVYEGTPPQ